MATIDLPNNILEALSTVLQQLQQSLPEVKQAPDFSAIAFKWENGELKAIHQLKRIELNDLKGIERQKKKYCKIQNSFSMVYLPMTSCLQALAGQVNPLLCVLY